MYDAGPKIIRPVGASVLTSSKLLVYEISIVAFCRAALF